MTIPRRIVLATLGAASVLPVLVRRALAAYPERPIHLIVPFAAGGNADIVGRITGDVISKTLNQPVVVENRGGAGGGVGAEFVAHATPDGYTLLVGSNGPLTVNPFVHADLGYDPLKDFVAVALTSYVPHALIMSSKVQAKNMTELIAQSKTMPLTVATSGIGSATHMTLERLSGDDGSWYRMNRTFLSELRKQFLQWRSSSPQKMLTYVEESRRLFGAKRADDPAVRSTSQPA